MSVLDFSDLKGTGQIIKYNNEPYQIIWSNFMRTAQRKPVIQTKMRNLITGKVMEYSFKYGEKVEGADVIKKKMQFLYSDDSGASFMDPESFDTVILPKQLVAEQIKFLKEGTETLVIMFEEKPIGLDLPVKIELKVAQTAPGVKGDTATGGTKPATLETGYVVNVPLFIKEGDVVRVNTQSGDYVERASL
ncbi:MAG: elongation factor P [Candidatus Doudnabacteria bacterium]|nr:elongation factor P [Candidatus Doudnabacteria bacterium]